MPAAEIVDIAFRVSRQVVSLPVIDGQTAAAGEVIAELDQDFFELDPQSARLNLEQAERTMARRERLAGSTASQVAIDDAETALALARVGVANTLLFMQLRQPAIIWLLVPMSINTVVVGLIATGQPFTFTALLALLSLSGMLIKNEIVLVEEIDL